MPLMAEVANTWPLLPTDRTTIDATTTIKSESRAKPCVCSLVRRFDASERERERSGKSPYRTIYRELFEKREFFVQLDAH